MEVVVAEVMARCSKKDDRESLRRPAVGMCFSSAMKRDLVMQRSEQQV